MPKLSILGFILAGLYVTFVSYALACAVLYGDADRIHGNTYYLLAPLFPVVEALRWLHMGNFDTLQPLTSTAVGYVSLILLTAAAFYLLGWFIAWIGVALVRIIRMSFRLWPSHPK